MEYEFVHVKLSLILYYSSFTGAGVFILQYPIDLEQYDRREQLKKSGLGKVSSILSRSCHDQYFFSVIVFVREYFTIISTCLQVIMFLSKSDEETTSNRKLAKDLVDKWVNLIYIWYYIFPVFEVKSEKG